MKGLGTGLASSSALTVGILNALHAFKGEYTTPEQLAKEAIDIEINKLGQQIGIQDQYAVAYGGFNRYVFNFDDTVSITPIIIDKEKHKRLIDRFMLFYTGVNRDSRAIFVEQKKTINNKKEILDSLIENVQKAWLALQNNELDEWGRLLHETWQTKKKFASGVSNAEIDQMYDSAISGGALGGKILGAGGGGFLLLYVPLEKQDNVRKSLFNYKEVSFAVDMQGSRIIFSD